MIRDPSDGSVREPDSAAEVGIPTTKSAPATSAPHNSGERGPSVMPDSPGADTGLPNDDYVRPDLSQRLKKSREWMANFHRRKAQQQEAAE